MPDPYAHALRAKDPQLASKIAARLKERSREETLRDHDGRIESLEEQVEALTTKVEEAESFRGELEAKLARVQASERSWRAVMQTRDAVVFRSDLLEIAELPLDLVRLIATRRPLDVLVFEDEETDLVRFCRDEEGKEEVAGIPRALFACLDAILEKTPYATRVPPSQSQASLKAPRPPTRPGSAGGERVRRSHGSETGKPVSTRPSHRGRPRHA